MFARPRDKKRTLEIMLIVVALGMMALYARMGAYQIVALNLFFLPIVLSGYYLGRGSTGVLALLCALAVSIITTMRPTGFEAFASPVAIGLALSVWAAALGLTAILTGTLCDERSRAVDELQRAYVGVVEVLSKYLQSANPNVKNRSTRVAELCQLVAGEMRLPSKLLDDIRVAALLHDLEDVEVTTNLISKAVHTLDADRAQARTHTFLGADLVHSLGAVLDGALPLLVGQDAAASECLSGAPGSGWVDLPLGARIITAVRSFDVLTEGSHDHSAATRDAIRRLRQDSPAQDAEILDALARVVSSGAESPSLDESDRVPVGVSSL